MSKRFSACTRTLQPLILSLITVASLSGCKDLTGSPGLPSGTPDPTSYANAAGARGMRVAALAVYALALPEYVIDAGLLTDELKDPYHGTSITVSDPLDQRILPEGVSAQSDGDYANLQGVRSFTSQAIGALVTYDTAAADTAVAKVLRGELYAITGYSEIFLADLFCSGVPLSTLDFQHDFTYHTSSTTAQLYQHARALFDTAIVLVRSSDSVANLVRVGRARSWLAQGQYDSAAAVVAQIPDGFQYRLTVNWGDRQGGPNLINVSGIVSDREGRNGLPFLSSGDPRTTAVQVDFNGGGVDFRGYPAKYADALSGSGYVPFTLASGVEARLIQAEAALHRSPQAGTWLQMLNALRTTGAIDQVVANTSVHPTQFDTVWHAGTGGVSGLRPLADPIAPDARVDLLFAERAAWLYMTGARQHDLRRLVRQYGRNQDRVYPTGTYLGLGTGRYGSDVNAPIPTAETANPNFHGCLDRNA